MKVLLIEGYQPHRMLHKDVLEDRGVKVDTMIPEESRHKGSGPKMFKDPSELSDVANDYNCVILDRETFSSYQWGADLFLKYLTKLDSYDGRVIVTTTFVEVKGVQEMGFEETDNLKILYKAGFNGDDLYEALVN